MFTDSSFYSSKHHPTVADQVEMAHRLTSALFKEDNKHSKGQQMYLNRMKKSGKLIRLAEFFLYQQLDVGNNYCTFLLL